LTSGNSGSGEDLRQSRSVCIQNSTSSHVDLRGHVAFAE
jgi:hypothetical protein